MKILLAILCIGMCLSLSSCAYDSVNMLRAQGGDVFVFWGTGWVKAQNSSVTLYRSQDSFTYIKGKDYPKIPARPTITELGEGGSINIGKVQKVGTVTTTPVNRSGPLEAAGGIGK